MPMSQDNIRCPICQSKWLFTSPFETFDCSFCNSEIPLGEFKKIVEQKLIEKFIKDFDYINTELGLYIDVSNTITIDIPLLKEKLLKPLIDKWEEWEE